MSNGKRKRDETCGQDCVKIIKSNFSFVNSKDVLNTNSVECKLDQIEQKEENSDLFAIETTCFSCKLKDHNLVKCSVDACEKYYHSKCLEQLRVWKTELNSCPLHVCLTCHQTNPKNPLNSKGDVYKCFKCPSAFHAKDECCIPGAVLLTYNVMSCPDHFSPEKLREYESVVNLPFCVECGCNENLIFCRTCPASMHAECFRTKRPPAGNSFICQGCDARKTLTFNQVVWAKVYDFSWWPARILNPKEVPASVQKMTHFEGEFPVRFFGSDDYFWVSKGRVHSFVSKQISLEDTNADHNFKKFISNKFLDRAKQLAMEAVAEKRFTDAERPLNGRKFPPYKHIRSNRPIGGVQIYSTTRCNKPLDPLDVNPCGCKPSEIDPCGYNSLCLNRSMCTECDPSTCEAGELCQNQMFQKLQYAKAKPFFTSTRGWGLRSAEPIPRGHFVMEYCGDLIDEEECRRRIKEKQETGDTNFYFCSLDSTRIIDAGPKGNFSRFMNHSCEPNCETQKWIVAGDIRVGLFARSDIPAGSELTFNYQMDFSHYEKLKCNCGAERCSGIIGKRLFNGAPNSYKHTNGNATPKEPLQTLVSKRPQNDKDSTTEEEAKVPKVATTTKKETIPKVATTTKKETILKVATTNEETKVPKMVTTKEETRNQKMATSKEETKVSKAAKSVDGKQVSVAKELPAEKRNGLKGAAPRKRNRSKREKEVCFKCKTGGKLLQCSLGVCAKSFHFRCLGPADAEDAESSDWECPRHFCKKCRMLATYQCTECPNSYCVKHVTNCKTVTFLCPKHFK